MSEKRYYWLKLSVDFFQAKSIKKLRKIAGGDTYTVVYLKMLLKSLSSNGKLYFEGIEKTFAEEIALDIDENEDDVRVVISFLLSSGLMTESPDGDEVMLEQVPEMVGCETASAIKKRNSRKKTQGRDIVPQGRDIVPQGRDIVQKCPTEIEIEKDIECRDREESEKSQRRVRKREDISAQSSTEPSQQSPPIVTIQLNTGEEYPVYQEDIDQYIALYPSVDIEQQLRNMKAWSLSNPAKRKTIKGIKRFINSWLAREQDKPHLQQTGGDRYAEKLKEVANWQLL